MRKHLLLMLLFIISITYTEASSLQLFQAGKKAFSVGLYSIALENFDLYLKEDVVENRAESLYLSGISAYYLKKYSISLTYLLAINSEYPDSTYVDKSLYWVGLDYYYLDDYKSASNYFKRNSLLDTSYKDISILFNALSLIKIGEIDGAIDNFKLIIESKSAQDRYKEEAIYRLGTLYLEEGNTNNAINTLNKIVMDYPDSKFFKDALSILADSYFSLNEWGNAKRSYELLMDLKEDELYYKRLATINWNLGSIPKATLYLESYKNIYGADLEVLTMLGDLYLASGSNKEAADIYVELSKVLTDNKEIDENNYRIGVIYYREKNFEEAFNYLKLVESKDSLYFSVISGLEAGREVFNFIEKLNREFINDKLSLDANNRYINYLDKNGTKEKFEGFLKYLTELYPDNEIYFLTYGEFLLENRRLEESLKYLSKGYKEGSPNYGNISYKIGWIYYTKGEYVRSIKYFNNLNRGDRDFVKALYSKSIANYKLGRVVEGKTGFLELLSMDTPFNSEIAFYLGLIEKNAYNYELALKYFNISKGSPSLYEDSLESIAWCYYHIKDYTVAIEKYRELYELTGNTLFLFNLANCQVNIEKYDDALKNYKIVIDKDDSNKSSSYYKSVEILFYLNRDVEAFDKTRSFFNDFPESELPGEVILNEGDNRLYSHRVDEAISIFNTVMKIFPKGKVWYKARFRLAECFNFMGQFEKSIDTYLTSIKESDEYQRDSVEKIVSILSKEGNPELTLLTRNMIDNSLYDVTTLIPIYTEFINQGVTEGDPLEEVDLLISLSKDRDEINRLIYLKSLLYYNNNEIDSATATLGILLSRGEVLTRDKIDGIMLQGKILDDLGSSKDAIDLYLKIYINYPNEIDSASIALYKGLLLSREIGDKEMENKIINILKSEYSNSEFGIRVINEN